jgi:hypothetical protein
METYGVSDHQALPVPLLATLAAGLRDDSRSKMSLSGRKATRTEALLAAAVDRLSRVAWLLSFVCPANGEPPKSVLSAILGERAPENGGAAMVFESPEAYEQEWKRITGVNHGTE